MAWVQVGNRKINTATVCYMEQQEDEKLCLHFNGQQNTLELSPEESRALWKHLKSEDAMAVKDKGSTMVLPKRWSAAPPEAVPAASTPAKPLQVAVGQNNASPAPVAAAPSSSHQKPHSSHGHGHGHSSSHKPHSSSHSASGHSSSHRPSSSSHQHSSSSSQHRSSSHSSSPSSPAKAPAQDSGVLGFKD